MTLDSGSTSVWSSRWYFTTYTLPPTNLSPQAGNLKITLMWTASVSPNIRKYRIYRGTSSPASTLHDSTTSTSYIDTGLTNGTQYFYRITTENSQYLEGPFSSEVNAKPLNKPPIPTSLNNASLLNTGRALTNSLMYSSSGSTDPDGTVDSTLWFVNYQRVGTQPSLTYDFGPGTSRVTLVVADNQNARDSSVVFVNRAAYVKALNGPVYSGLSMVGSNVLYGIASGDAVYRLDSNETMVYKLQVAGSSGSSCSIAYDSTVYISSSDNDLYAFSKNATSVWAALPLGGNTSATPTVDSTLQRVYIGVSNNNFLGVNRLTGSVVWNFFTSSPTSNSAVISSDRRLVFPTNDGTVYGVDLDASDAPTAPTWTFSLPDASPTSPAIDQYGYFYFGTASGNLYAVSMKRGEQASQLWSLHLGGQLLAAPVIDANGILYIGSTDSTMYAVNLSSKSIAWELKTNGSIRYTAAVSPAGYIYFDNDAGVLYCLDNSGNIEWSFNDPGDALQVIGPILYNNGMVYAGAGTKSVIALYDGNANQASPSRVSSVTTPVWGTFQGNNQRTGIQPIQIISSVSNDNGKIPTSYALYANYPNPFNPATIISYDIPKFSHVALIVYDILGRQVAILVNEEKKPGSYQTIFDGSGLASGVYLYKLQAGTYSNTKKLLLLK
jgi:outer membrane protein assembly factor BamB